MDFFLNLLEAALKTHNFQHDISPLCMELNNGAKVFIKSHLQIYVQTVNLSREIIAVWIQRYSIVIDKDFGPIVHSSGSWILFTFHIRISPTLFLNSFFYNVLCGTQHFTTTKSLNSFLNHELLPSRYLTHLVLCKD